jgi:replicative DNA helicase
MDGKPAPKSEAAELDAFLEKLQRPQVVREIAGWETGFPRLSRLLNGVLPGLYFLTGRPGCGKTSFAKQLLDQVIVRNSVVGIFFTFAEKKDELRIRTLARLSELETSEIRRGSAFLLHWYGVPKRSSAETDRLPPSWEKLKRAAEDARSWLEQCYLVECDRGTKLQHIADQISAVRDLHNGQRVFVVIDDCQRLAVSDQAPPDHIVITTEQLQAAAVRFDLPMLAVWPDLRETSADHAQPPQAWGERVTGDVVLVLEGERAETKQPTEPNQAVALHVVKNRGGEKGKLGFSFLPGFSKFAEIG